MSKDLEITMKKASYELHKLRFMARTDDSLIHMQISTMDYLMTKLIVDFNYTPSFKDEYDRICDEYYEPIKARKVSEYLIATDIDHLFSNN